MDLAWPVIPRWRGFVAPNLREHRLYFLLHPGDQFPVPLHQLPLRLQLGDDLTLGVERRKRNRNVFDNSLVDFWHASRGAACIVSTNSRTGLLWRACSKNSDITTSSLARTRIMRSG